MKQFLQRCALMALALSAPFAAQAQVSLTGGTYSQNFDTLANSGTSSTLPAGWLMSESGTNANTTYTAGTGSGNAGDTYSFGAAAATDRAFGGLLSGSLTPTVGACFTNNTGNTISSFEIAYTGEQWRYGATGRADRLDFQYSTSATSLTTGTWTDFNTLDYTAPNLGGTAGARDGNAAANRDVLSPATVNSGSIANGATFCIRWTDFNATGADDGLAIDDFSITVAGVPLPGLSINDVSATEGDSGTTDFTFTISLSAAAAANVTVNYATSSDSATSGTDFNAASGTATIIAGDTSTTVTVQVIGDTDLEINETFFVTLSSPSANATIADASGTGTITNDDIVITAIGAIQGSGELSARDGQLVMTEGVVTGKRSNGFFLQSFGSEGNPAADGDAATSDGIFVFTSAAPGMVVVGDHVRVVGTVDEFLRNGTALPDTEIVSPSVSVLGNGVALPAPVELTSALAGPGSLPDAMEHLEGMLVSVASGIVTASTDGFINESSATSGNSNSAFEFVVAGVSRPMREPGLSIIDPFPVPPAKQATLPYFDANQERIKAFPLQGNSLVAEIGATVTELVGALTYFGDSWEVLYDLASPPTITGGATATAVSDQGANDITVGGFNLQRFFDTVNDAGISDVALSPAAFANRLAKTGAAICDWVKAPDILGVVEVENIGALTELANYINGNCASTPDYTAYLQEGHDPGGIDVGFLVSDRAVRTGVSRVAVASVTQVGKDTDYAYPVGCTPGSAGCSSGKLNDRPSLALRATVNFADGRRYPLTVIANHLRSLNGNDDPADGRVRYKRAEQALELANYVNGLQVANPSEKIVLVGDFNAFPFNDGYVDSMGIITGNAAPEEQVIEYRASPVATPLVLGDELTADPAQRYSYVFAGNAQTLDHAVVNAALVNDPAITGLTVEHARINADFRVAHYGEYSLPYSEANPPLRVSDHDPVRLTIGVVRPLSADLTLDWDVASMSSRGAFTRLTLFNASSAAISGAQVRIDLEIPAKAMTSVGPPSGWTCEKLGDSSYLCTASKPVVAGGKYIFGVSVRPRHQFAATDTIRLKAQATVLTDPIDGDNSVELVLP